MLLRIAAILFFFVTSALADSRAAFIVGNSAYDAAGLLQNPGRDAQLIADTLKTLDFSVTTHFDLTRRDMTRALRAFLSEHENADVTLFYFAGHGMQFEGKNYLLGTDAILESEFDVEAETIALDRITRMIEAKSRSALIFVDACRNNPLADRFYRENFSETRALMTRGLAQARVSDGSMLVFSASPGQVAFDGSGANSPFAASLARHLPSENVEVLSLMKRVIRDVKTESGDKQVPMVTNDLTNEVYLNLGEGGVGAQLAYKQEETIFEAAVAIGTRRAWEIYLRRYPSGNFSEVAQAELERMEVADLASASGTEVTQGKPVSVKRNVAQAYEAKLGLSKDDNRAVQEALNAKGYDVGQPDGAVGPRTRKAIADFQAAVSLPVTGVITKATAAALGLELSSTEESSVALVSSSNARRYDPDQLALVEDDERLIKAVKALGDYEVLYGYHDGKLYLGVLTFTTMNIKQANALAERAGGYLATLTSRDENDFVFDLVKNDQRFWPRYETGVNGPGFGHYQVENAREPDGGWVWVTGEEVTFTNWRRGQPNNSRGKQYMATFEREWRQSTPPEGGIGAGSTWGDAEVFWRSIVIEID